MEMAKNLSSSLLPNVSNQTDTNNNITCCNRTADYYQEDPTGRRSTSSLLLIKTPLNSSSSSSISAASSYAAASDNTGSALSLNDTIAISSGGDEDDLWRQIVDSIDSSQSFFGKLQENLTFFAAAGSSASSNNSSTNVVRIYQRPEDFADHFYNYTKINNDTDNATLFDGIEFPWDTVTMIGTAVVLGLLILATVIGNVFVIAAILLERNLQNVANYLILSLAVADLLVACLVMPLGAVYEVSHEWTLGPELCDMWTSSDVLCCTASILHLVAIALDRYWAVTNIDYIHQRTAKRIGIMILIVWCVAFLVCIAPLLGWKDPGWSERIEDNQCIVSQDIGYQIFATASSFYLPLLVILVLYWRIFQTARKRIRRRQILTQAVENKANPSVGIAGGLTAAGVSGGIAAAVVTIIGRPLPTISETTTTTTAFTSSNASPEKASCVNGLDDPPTTTDGPSGGGTYQYPPPLIKKKSKDSADSKRERKAAKTLAIITGAFVICWLPFFVMAVLLPIYQDWFDDYMVSLFLWLGYFNSTLNPIIYTIFSPEFRHAFKKILLGRNYARQRRQNRHFNIKHFQ